MGPLVLVVEDDDDLRETLCEGLRLLGCEAACERSWDGALKRLYAGTARYHGPNARLLPDIVVLDYMMPGMDGLAILRFMRSRSEYRQIPVLVVTGAHGVRSMAFAAGAAAFLQKPFTIADLESVVRMHVDCGGGQCESG